MQPMIPRIIHQTWRTNELPHPLRDYCRSWRRSNPEADYRFYDDSACRAFVQSEFPEFSGTYEALPFPIQRADFFRYLAVFRYGGLYADADMECLLPLDQFFQMEGALFCIETRLTRTRQRELGYLYPYQIANCIFAAEAGHPFLWELIETAAGIAAKGLINSPAQVEDATGPRLVTRRLFDFHKEQPHILEQIYWMPPTLYPRIFPLDQYMFTRHHFLGSWKTPPVERLGSRRLWIERSLMPNPFPASMFHHFG
jgi:mannosyltransferase OCH1-like enzyme